MGCGSSKATSEPDPSAISQYEVNYLRDKVRFSEEEIRTWHEAFVYEYPDGQMDRAGIVSLYSKLYPKGSAADFAQQLFRVYDKDQSGKIDFREFITTMDVCSKGSTDEKLAWAFSLYDADGSGYLTRDEVVQIVGAIYKIQGLSDTGATNYLSPGETVDEILKTLEKDNDGKLSEKEFVHGAKTNQRMKGILQSI